MKTQDCEQLEKDMLESQAMMEQGAGRIQELEEVQAQLQKQVGFANGRICACNAKVAQRFNGDAGNTL